MATRRLERVIVPICVVLGLAALMYLLAAVWAGSADTAAALRRLGVAFVGFGALVCVLSLALRVLRWRYVLAQLGHRLPLGFGLRVYLAGVALSATPGKLGETLRSVLLQLRGVPVPRSLAAFVTDRLADVIAVAGLGALSAVLAGRSQPVLAAIAVAALLGAALLAAALRSWGPQPGAGACKPPAGGLPRHGWAWLAWAGQPAQVWAQLWQGRRVPVCVGFAVLAYGVQALLFGLLADQVARQGAAVSHPGIGLADGVQMFCAATLIGAASLLPGGLGAMDTALVLQLQARGLALSDAVAAALVTRACTLWLAWAIGGLSLLSFVRGAAWPDEVPPGAAPAPAEPAP